MLLIKIADSTTYLEENRGEEHRDGALPKHAHRLSRNTLSSNHRGVALPEKSSVPIGRLLSHLDQQIARHDAQ